MKLPDWLLLALNALLLFLAFMGVASTDADTLIVASMLAMVTAAVNGVVVIGRRKEREPAAKRPAARSQENEMDARTVLDIDARLEALERREREAADADRIQQMVARGQQHAPEAPLAESTAPEPRRERA